MFQSDPIRSVPECPRIPGSWRDATLLFYKAAILLIIRQKRKIFRRKASKIGLLR